MKFLLALSFLLPICATSRADPYVVSTGLVSFRGKHFANEGVTAYLGIPFAAPPVGKLRWKPPQPPSKSSGVRNATSLGHSCHQSVNVFEIGGQVPEALKGIAPESEDCLTLNIWVPSDRPKEPLAVLFFIHSGAFIVGSSSMSLFDGKNLATKGIIVVSTNYRLGIMGFPFIPSEIPVKDSNLGLLDIRAAIKWTRENIRHFGGDPDKVTLAGQSAGSMAIDYLAYAFPKNLLARSVIMQSGQTNALFPPWNDQDGHIMENLAKSLNCTAPYIPCLSTYPASLLANATSADPSYPHIDNFTVFPQSEYPKKSPADVPTILGTTHNEGDILAPMNPGGGIDYALSDQITEFMFTCPAAVQTAARRSRGIKTWRYRWMPMFPNRLFTPEAANLRAWHGSELPLVFGNFESTDETELKAKEITMNAWSEFVKRPEKGLGMGEKGLVEMFKGNTTKWEVVETGKYDRNCAVQA